MREKYGGNARADAPYDAGGVSHPSARELGEAVTALSAGLTLQCGRAGGEPFARDRCPASRPAQRGAGEASALKTSE